MQVEIVLNNRRPILMSRFNVNVLLDSGAGIPVWVISEMELENLYQASKSDNCVALISGFGGKGRACPIYIIPMFKIGGVIFHDLPIALYDKSAFGDDFQMVLPVNIFSACSILVNTTENGYVKYVDISNNLPRADRYCKPHYKLLEKDGVKVYDLTAVGVSY